MQGYCLIKGSHEFVVFRNCRAVYHSGCDGYSLCEGFTSFLLFSIVCLLVCGCVRVSAVSHEGRRHWIHGLTGEPLEVGVGSSALLAAAASSQAPVMANFDCPPDWTCSQPKTSPVSE